MPGFDPAQGFAAQGAPRTPVGASDELAAHKLPTRVFYSCSEPAHDGTNLGCPLWHECSMSYKGLPASEGGGPRSHCWERIKSPAQGGGIVRNVQPCFWGVEQQEVCRENGEVLRPIADEGEDYEILTTVPVPEAGKDSTGGYALWEPRLLKCKVEPFKRIGEEKKLAQHELRASIMKREQERADRERAAKASGVQGTDVPLDKRGKGSSAGKATKD